MGRAKGMKGYLWTWEDKTNGVCFVTLLYNYGIGQNRRYPLLCYWLRCDNFVMCYIQCKNYVKVGLQVSC